MKELKLLGKIIDLDECPVLLSCSPSDGWQEQWQVMDGEWEKCGEWLVGTERGNSGGILLSRTRFDQDVVFSYTSKTILPASRDINCLFCAEWDTDKDELKTSYITGINGWYEGKSGLERHPEDQIKAINGLYTYEPGKEIRVTCGSVQGHAFLYIDGALICELVDPDGLTGGRVGFSPFCTRMAVKDIEVRAAKFRPRIHEYAPEF